MDQVLLVAATRQEIQPLLNEMVFAGDLSAKLKRYRFGGREIAVLITGVGLVATAFEMGRALCSHKFSFALNLGIAGAFNRGIDIGEVLNVASDTIADMGAQNGEAFLSMAELGLMDGNMHPFKNNWLTNEHQAANIEIANLKKVRGISVNQVHGEEKAIEKVSRRLAPDVESMEGAAFFYACFTEGLPCAQIRSISNYVEPRNRENWNIPLAVKNLNGVAKRILLSGF